MKLKKILLVLLAFVFALGMFVGCGSGGSTIPDDKKLTIFRWDFAAVDSARKQKTPIYKEIMANVNDEYPIHVKTSGSANWEDVLNKDFNGGTMADIFVCYAMDRPTNFKKWVKDGAVLPISDYVSETKYPNVYKRLQEFDYLKDRIDYFNGKHYALPIETTLEHGMFIRLDWIENLNKKLPQILVQDNIISSESQMTEQLREQYEFKVPETLTEFYRLTRAFAKFDPDNDGNPNNTYGYTCSETNMWFNNWIFEAMSSKADGAHDTTYWGWVEDGKGGITSSWVTEGNKKAVAFLNKLYVEGILDPDYIATTAAQKQTKFVQGKVGIMVGNMWYNTILNDFMSANGCTAEEAKTRFTVINPPKGESGAYGMKGNPGFWCSVCINGRLSETERDAALTLLDYLYSDEADELFTYGVEGVHYEVQNGEKVSLMGQDSSGFNKTLETEDAAWALSSLSSWEYSYYSPYQSNAELIEGFMDNAKEYTRVDPVMYVQTPLYVENDTALANSALEQFVGMIKNADLYGSAESANPDWSNLYTYNDAYNKAWNNFVDMYLNSWGGQAMIDEFSAEASKYLNQ